MGTVVAFDIGHTLSIRHGADQSALFEFQFELDIDAMEEAGLGNHTYFCFIYDVGTGTVVEISSSTESGVLRAAQVHPDYDGNMGTEYVLKYEGRAGLGDVVYTFLSYEPGEIDDPEFADTFDEINAVFFDICAKTLAAAKANLL